MPVRPRPARPSADTETSSRVHTPGSGSAPTCTVVPVVPASSTIESQPQVARTATLRSRNAPLQHDLARRVVRVEVDPAVELVAALQGERRRVRQGCQCIFEGMQMQPARRCVGMAAERGRQLGRRDRHDAQVGSKGDHRSFAVSSSQPSSPKTCAPSGSTLQNHLLSPFAVALPVMPNAACRRTA